jgi:hypothetical protein
VDRGSCDSRAVPDAAPKTEIGSIVGLRRRVAGMAPQILSTADRVFRQIRGKMSEKL